MRICFSLTNLELGGAQVFVCRLANYLAANGHRVFIYDHWPEHRDKGTAAMISPGVTVLSYSKSTLWRNIIWKTNALLRAMHLQKEFRHSLNRRVFFRKMKQHNIEVVNSHMLFSEQMICGGDEELTFRLVVAFHGEYEMFIEAGQAKIARETLRPVLNKASALIVTADKNFLAFPDDKTKLPPISRISIGIDPQAFRKKHITKSSVGFDNDDFVVGMVSRGIPEKGWDTCIEVVKRFNAQATRKIKLLMIGNGAYLRDLVQQKGTPEMKLVQFSSDVQDYFSYYQLFDVFLFPTRFPGESFPNVVIESLYWGVPVISAGTGSIPEMIKDDEGRAGGICIDNNTVITTENFLSALNRLAVDKNLRAEMARTAKKAFGKFHIADVAEAYLNVFRSVL